MQDLDAAQTLGISRKAYNKNVDISITERGAIEKGMFRPYYPSLNIQRAFADNAAAIGVTNPMITASRVINSIQRQLFGLSLDTPEFPNIENPLVPMNLGTTLPNIGAETLNAPPVNANVAANQGGNIPYNQLTTSQKIDILFGQG